MKYSCEIVGNNIRKERVRLGLSQKQLGEEIYVSGKQISNYENGKTAPPFDKLLDLCDIFGCELGYLLGESAYVEGTTFETQISNQTGLSKKAINNIIMITGTTSDCLDSGEHFERYRFLLNQVVSSKTFASIFKSLYTLDKHYAILKGDNMEQLELKLGKSRFDKAIDNFWCMQDREHAQLQLSETQFEDYLAVADIINKQGDVGYALKVDSYDLWRKFEALIEENYPLLKENV